MRRRALAGAAAASLLALVPALAPGAAAAASCKPATSIEAIVDDSLSMETNDPNRLRVQGLDLLIDTLPARTKLGAIEFGSSLGGMQPAAETVFALAPIGTSATAMKAALSSKINADDGLTDYNGAFALADSENPNAQARIFLTDGGQTEGEYANGHLAHPAPTYVVGFGRGLSGAEDRERLERIAVETGGRYYPRPDASRLQAAINEIAAELSCQPPPRAFADKLARRKAATHAVTITAATGSARIVLSWASPLDRFKLGGLRLVQPGRAAKPRRLKVERHGSATFSVVEVAGLGAGRLQFTVTAAKLGSGEPKVTLATQVSQEKGD